MNRTEYRTARRWIRDNGRTAYRWIAAHHGQAIADDLQDLANAQDWLQERADIVAYCKRKSLTCTPFTTRPSWA